MAAVHMMPNTAPTSLGSWRPGGHGVGDPYLPQGSKLLTSGISADDAYNIREQEAALMLGPPPKLQEEDPRSRFPREITLLPERWSGPGGSPQYNKYLTQYTIFFQDEAMRELVRVMAPPALFIGNPVHQMKALYFNRPKVDKYTHTGVPRLVSYSWERWSAATARVGLGAEFDEEMIGTPEGTELIRNSIKQIQIAVIDHCGTELISALLAARPQPQNFYEAHELPVPNELAMRLFSTELEHWGIMQKTPHGLAKLAAYAQRQIELQQGSKSDVVIMPGSMATYLQYDRPELTNYMQAGPSGPARLEAGAPTVLNTQLSGLRVLPAPLLPESDDAPPRDPLDHLRMIGEFFRMHWRPHSHLKASLFTPQGADALKQLRTIYVHDNVSDTMQPITIDMIIDFFTDIIAGNYANKRPGVPREMQARLAGEALKAANAFKNANGWMDYNVLLVRPHMLYSMSMFIFGKSGGETAETLVGYGDARWGRDATRKKALLHYTTYAGCIIKKPHNIWIANCVSNNGCIQGGGVELGIDLFPILVHKSDNRKDVALFERAQFMGVTSNAFTGIVDEPGDTCLSTIDDWARAYGFRKNAAAGLMFNNYHGYQDRNARVFLGPFNHSTCDSDGNIRDPQGTHSYGKGHWGPYAYDNVGEARMGKGHTPYVVDPYAAKMRL